MDWVQIIVTVLCAALTSSGLWAYLSSRRAKNNAEAELLLGLGHTRIMALCDRYIKRGYITADEYEDLHDYLFVPYTKMNGNGSAARQMEQVKKLPSVKEGE